MNRALPSLHGSSLEIMCLLKFGQVFLPLIISHILAFKLLNSPQIPICSGEKPFKCDVCDKTFARGGQLIVHKRVHNGEKPYNCDQCDMKFSSSGNLKLHSSQHQISKVEIMHRYS